MKSHHLESGRALTSLLFLILILAAALGGVAFIFGTVVPIGYVGVRKVAFGPGQGLGTKPLDPGFHWTIPGYSTIYQVPQSIKILDFDRDTRTNQNSFGSLDIPTVDGTTVDIDAAVLYRFFSKAGKTAGLSHGGAAELINQVGATEAQWGRYISQVAENELKRALSALSTVEFYDPKTRDARMVYTEQQLRERLAPLGVRIDAVLLRRYTYRAEIDQAIFKKNLQELESAYNKVGGEFAEAQRDVNKVETDGVVAIQNLDKQGISEAEKIRSEGDLYRREKIAQGTLLIAKAKATNDRMRNEVLSKVGSDVYVALQLAQSLASLKGGVVANVDPYDFDGWVKKLSGANPVKLEKDGNNDAQP